MAVPPAPDGAVGETAPDSTTPNPDPAPSRAVGWRRLLLVGFVTVVVGCLVSLVFLAVDRRGDDGDSASPQAQREELMSQVSQFVLRINTYGPQLLDAQNKMPDYVEGVSELMTAKFGAGFKESVLIPEQQVAQTGYGRTAQVYAVGVSTMDADSATVLVAFGRTDSYPDPESPDQRVELGEDPERWEVQLVTSDGEWLVDDYTVISETPSTEGDPQDLPSGSPTQQPTNQPSRQPTKQPAPGGGAS